MSISRPLGPTDLTDLVDELLAAGAARERDERSGGALLAAWNDWVFAHPDLDDAAVHARFLEVHDIGADTLAAAIRGASR